MTINLCMLSIKVTNIMEAKQFYCEKLGFNIEKEYGDSIVELSGDGFPILLESANNMNRAKYGEDSQIVLGLKTEDLKDKTKELSSKDIKFLFDEPQKCPPGYFNVIVDPFGNHIEILEFSV